MHFTIHGTVLALSQVTALYWHCHKSRHCIGIVTGHGTVLALSRHFIGTLTSHGTVLTLTSHGTVSVLLQVTALYWHFHKSRHFIDTHESRHCIDTPWCLAPVDQCSLPRIYWAALSLSFRLISIRLFNFMNVILKPGVLR